MTVRDFLKVQGKNFNTRETKGSLFSLTDDIKQTSLLLRTGGWLGGMPSTLAAQGISSNFLTHIPSSPTTIIYQFHSYPLPSSVTCRKCLPPISLANNVDLNCDHSRRFFLLKGGSRNWTKRRVPRRQKHFLREGHVGTE